MINKIEKILLISQSATVAKSLRRDIKSLPDLKNSTIKQVPHFQKSKAEITTSTFQLIILDARKQKLSPLEMGIEICSLTKNCPLIILNNAGQESQAINCLKGGASDYILTTKDWLENLPYAILHTLEEYSLKDLRKKEISKLRNELYELRELRSKMNDSQTLLYPKNKFKDLFLSEAKRAERHQFDLSCLVFEIPAKLSEDLDANEFVDNFGQLLPHIVRRSDYWTNLKPGVFAAILPHTNKKQAKEAAQRISTEIKGELPKNYHDKGKVSFSISTFNHLKDANPDQMFEKVISAYQ